MVEGDVMVGLVVGIASIENSRVIFDLGFVKFVCGNLAVETPKEENYL